MVGYPVGELGATVLHGTEVLGRLVEYCARAAAFELRDKAESTLRSLMNAPHEATIEGSLRRLDEAYHGCLELEQALLRCSLPADANICARLAGEIAEVVQDLMDPTDRYDIQ